MNVCGIAEKNPAAVISSVLNAGSARFGVEASTNFLPRSYPYRKSAHQRKLLGGQNDVIGVAGEVPLTQKDTANMGVTPSRGGTIPRYNLNERAEVNTVLFGWLPRV